MRKLLIRKFLGYYLVLLLPVTQGDMAFLSFLLNLLHEMISAFEYSSASNNTEPYGLQFVGWNHLVVTAVFLRY